MLGVLEVSLVFPDLDQWLCTKIGRPTSKATRAASSSNLMSRLLTEHVRSKLADMLRVSADIDCLSLFTCGLQESVD